jgi:enamine deaminase RidA (YjgF/YER057c/UK114 family)
MQTAAFSSLGGNGAHHLLITRNRWSLAPLPLPTHTVVPKLNMVQTEKRMQELGITLPPAPRPAANYLPCQRSGDLLFLSGHLPLKQDGTVYTGKLGMAADADQPLQSVEYGYQAARQVGLNLIATLQQELDGDLDNVEQIVKLFGIVQSADSFHDQHKVVNGCSDLMIEVFGEDRGKHARSAIGTNSLPLNISVEIEAIVRVKKLN